jgi:hypothetical protein
MAKPEMLHAADTLTASVLVSLSTELGLFAGCCYL